MLKLSNAGKTFLLLLALALGFVAQSFFAKDVYFKAAVMLYALGAVLAVYALSKTDEGPDERRDEALERDKTNGALTLVLVLGAGILNFVALRYFDRQPPSRTGLAFYGASVLVAIYAFLRGERIGIKGSLADLSRSRKMELLLLALIVAVGAFLRFYRLLSVPVGLFGDEANNGLEAINVLEGKVLLPFGVGWGDNPMLFFYFVALFFKLFGVNVLAMKLVFVLMGIIAIPALYLLARQLFGPQTALISAALLAVSRWHVHFSRWAMQAVAITLWEVVAFYFLLRGLHTRRNRDFVLSAIALVLCLNTYVSARIVPVIIVLYLLHRLVFQRGFLARHYRGLIAFGVVFILIFAPFGWYFLDQPDHFLRRSQKISILKEVRRTRSWQPLAESVTKTLLMFNYKGDVNGRHNLPGEPMLNFFVSIPFVFGLGYSFYRWRRSRYFLLLAWFFLTLLTGFLSIEAPHAHRTLGAAPAAILFASLFLSRLGGGLAPVLGKRAFHLALAVLVLVVAYSGYDQYFNRMPTEQAVWGAFSSDATVVARHVSALSADHYLYVSYPYSGSPAVGFMTYGQPPCQLFDLVASLPATRARDGKVAYVLGSGYEGLLPVLRRYYPEGQLRRFRDPFQRPLLISYTVSDVEAGWGLMGRYYRGEAWSGEPALVRQDAVIDFDWGDAGAPLPAPFSVDWQGTILAPQYGPYTFGVRSSSEAALYIDGCLVIESQGNYVENTLALAKGLHAIELRCLEESGQGQIALCWSPAGGQKEIVPPNVLGLSPTVNGLLANYYRNESWSGTPAYAQIVPFLAYEGWGESVPKPSAGEWLGRLHVPKSGSYILGLEADDRAQLELDGQRLVDYDGRQGRQYLEHKIELSEGFHELRVRYLERRDLFVLRLWWTPPGGRAGAKEIVPMEALHPYTGPCLE
ncbi:MAG: glycosyltransferase family 39 protein [Anaerolineae bacterium]|nr:glycosyltransferase family 39 protein [Anaerolineae bacterium]